ncbi:hypothetical protein ACLMAL_08425 [Nocardia sp. CWNU-33]|uniref:hypothetical protein n=1 Tax=Nocardia sp. CWNU-33 TaxID=3392117 RepID=UPI00398ECB1A
MPDPDESMPPNGAPLHLILREQLPRVCSEHGRPAAQLRTAQIPFVDRRGGAERLTSARFLLRIFSRIGSRDPFNVDPHIVLHGDWPACPACLRRARQFVRIGQFLSAAAAITVVALVLALLQGVRGLVVPLVFAVFPGWFPVGLLLIRGAFERAEIFAHARMTPDRSHVVITAHPDFVNAVHLEHPTTATE